MLEPYPKHYLADVPQELRLKLLDLCILRRYDEAYELLQASGFTHYEWYELVWFHDWAPTNLDPDRLGPTTPALTPDPDLNPAPGPSIGLTHPYEPIQGDTHQYEPIPLIKTQPDPQLAAALTPSETLTAEAPNLNTQPENLNGPPQSLNQVPSTNDQFSDLFRPVQTYSDLNLKSNLNADPNLNAVRAVVKVRKPRSKISHLPPEIRDNLNALLRCGTSYSQAIVRINSQGYPGFNKVNLHHWRHRESQKSLYTAPEVQNDFPP